MGMGILLTLATGIDAGKINTKELGEKSVIKNDGPMQLSVANNRFNTDLSQSRIASISNAGNAKQITDTQERFTGIQSNPTKMGAKERALHFLSLYHQQQRRNNAAAWRMGQYIYGKDLKKNTNITLPTSNESYTIKKKLGEFSSKETGSKKLKETEDGVVYKVVNSAKNSFALKIGFKPEQYEATKLQKINELVPESIKIYDSGNLSNGQPYILMDYIDGTSYEDYCKINVCDPVDNTTPSMRAKVCNCIHKYHEVGILHNDLHTQNVLIDKTGNPRIIDFSRADLPRSKVERPISKQERFKDTEDFDCWENVRGKGFIKKD